MKITFFPMVIALVLLVVGAIGYGYGYYFVARESVAVATLAAQVEEGREVVARAQTATTLLAQLTADESAVRAYFVSEENIVAFLSDLQARGTVLGTKVNVPSVGLVSTGAPSLALSLTIEGKFDAVMRTLGTIEYAPYHIAVRGVDLARAPNGLWIATVTLSVGSLASTPAPTPQSP